MSSFTEHMNEKVPCKAGKQASLYSSEDVEKVTRIHFKEVDE